MSGVFSGLHQSDPANRARLRWRARRGLLENDLILTRFLDAHEEGLSDEEVDAFSRLMDLSDNALMDLLMAKKGFYLKLYLYNQYWQGVQYLATHLAEMQV